MPPPRIGRLLGTAVTAGLIAGCGSSSHSSHSSSSPSGPSAPAPSPSRTSTSGAGALSADARSAATGDIPDNQVFLTFVSGKHGFSMKYPEGWTQSSSGAAISFRDKNNLVRVIVQHGAMPTASSVSAQLAALKRLTPSLTFAAPHPVNLPAGPALRVRYTNETAPNPVTGKRVKLVVDRYELGRGGRVAVVDLGTPVGVDNVDAYRMMIQSFRWK
jgi:hypothetical protein